MLFLCGAQGRNWGDERLGQVVAGEWASCSYGRELVRGVRAVLGSERRLFFRPSQNDPRRNNPNLTQELLKEQWRDN